MAVASDPSFNFLQLCHIVLNDIPKQLREIFKKNILAKCGKEWVDNQACGMWLMKQERWHANLLSSDKQRLSSGNSEKWDLALLFHILLYSSHCFLADSTPVPCAIIQQQSTMVSSIPGSADLTEVIQTGDKVIVDLGLSCFSSTVVSASKSHFILKHPIKSVPAESPVQGVATVPFFKCKPEWLAIEKLFRLRDKYLAYCKTAVMTDKELQQFIQEVRRLYAILSIPGELQMFPLERAHDIAMNVQCHIQQWIEEDRCRGQITGWMDEVEEEVEELKQVMVKIMNVELPEMRGTLQNIEEAMAEAEKITSEMKEALQLDQQETVASCKSKVSQVMCIQEITGNIRLQLQKVSMDIAKVQMKQSEAKEGLQRQGKQLHSHDSALKQHNLKIKLAETHLESLQQQQHNSAARLNYSTETVKLLLSEQEHAQKKLDETEGTISAITAEKSQITKELDKTSQLMQELSLIETETAGNMSSLRNQVGQVRSDVEKIQDAALFRHMSSKTPLSKLNPSHFEGEITFYVEKYHPGTRLWLFNNLSTWHKKRQGKEAVNNLYLVTGNLGMGKSVVAAKFCAMKEKDGTLAGCFFFQHNLGRRNNPKMLVQTLVYQFYCKFSECREIVETMLEELDINRESAHSLFAKFILEPLSQLPEDHSNMYIVIDALDECNFETRQTLLNLILFNFVRLPKWLIIIMTCRPDQKITQKLNKVKPVFELVHDDPRNIHDIEIYLEDALRERMQQEQLKATIQVLLKKCNGMFLYFDFTIDSLLECKDLQNLLPDGIGEYYEQNFARLYKYLGKVKYTTLLEAVTASLGDLPVQFVCSLLNIELDEASSIIDIVSTVLPVQNGCIRIFHKSVCDWLTNEEEAGIYAVNHTQGHHHLAIQCYNILQEIKYTVCTPPDILRLLSDQEWKYAIQNLVMHLCNVNAEIFKMSLASSWQKGSAMQNSILLSVLLDMQFLYYKIRLSEGYVADTLEDFNRSMELLGGLESTIQKLNLCKTFLVQHANLFLKLPHLIFQCALNDSSGISEHLELQKYVGNPLNAFPEMKMCLEVAETTNTQSKLSSLAMFRCTDVIICYAQTPDEQLLIACTQEGFIHIWNRDTGELLHKSIVDNCLDAESSIVKPTKKKHSYETVLLLISRVNKLSISPDGKVIVYGDVTRALGTDGQSIFLINGVKRDTNNSIFSPDGKFLLSWTIPATGYDIPICVKLWNLEFKTCLQLYLLKNEQSKPLSGCFSHDSQYAFCGHSDGTIKQWRVSTGELVAVCYTDGNVTRSDLEKIKLNQAQEKEDPVKQIQCSGDGHFIAACYQSQILVWDAAAFVLLQTVLVSSTEGQLLKFETCSFSADGKFLVAGMSHGHVMVWVLRSGSKQPFKQTIFCRLSATAFSVKQCSIDCHMNVISAMGFSVYIHSYTALLEATLQASREKDSKAYANRPCLISCQILPNEKSVVTLIDYKLCLLQVPSLTLMSALSDCHVQQLGPWSANMNNVLAITPKGYAMVVDVVNFQVINQLDLPDGLVKWPNPFCHWSLSNDALVLKSAKGSSFYVLYNDGNSYSALKFSTGNKSPLCCLKFSKDGNTFISGDVSCTMIVWKVSLAEGKPEVEQVKQIALEFSINKNNLALFSESRLFASSGKNVRILSWPNCNQVEVMQRHRPSVRMIVASSDESLMVSASEINFPPNNMEIVIWEGSSGNVVSVLPVVQDSINCLSFACGNRFVCFYTIHDGMIHIFEASSGEPVSCLSFATTISFLTCSSDLVICILTDGSVNFLKMNTF